LQSDTAASSRRRGGKRRQDAATTLPPQNCRCKKNGAADDADAGVGWTGDYIIYTICE
jgi:hypothetical protein